MSWQLWAKKIDYFMECIIRDDAVRSAKPQGLETFSLA